MPRHDGHPCANAGGVLHGGANPCNNPTFQPGDGLSHNLLIDTAPFPAGCDEACQAPWDSRASGGGVSGPHLRARRRRPGGCTGQPAAAATAGTGRCGDPEPRHRVATPTPVCARRRRDLASAQRQAIPTVIGGQQGWAGPQTLMVIVGGLFVALLILRPPMTARVLDAVRRGRRAGAVAR